MDSETTAIDTTGMTTRVAERLEWKPVGGYPLTIGLAALLVVLLLLGPGRSRTTPLRRAGLVALRAVVILVLLFALMRPTWLSQKVDQQPELLILLVDGSRSMAVADMDGGRTRAQAADDLLRAAPAVFDETRDELEPQVYAFDSDVRSLELTDGRYPYLVPPTGDRSEIGRSLQSALDAAGDRTVAGVLLVSDGADYASDDRSVVAANAVEDSLVDIDHPIPLFTITLGTERAEQYARDVAVTDLSTSSPNFIKNALSAGGHIRIDGFDNQEVEVELSIETTPGGGKMEVVGTERVRGGELTRGSGKPVVFHHTPMVAGEYKVTLRAATMPGELKTLNNELSTFVTVEGEGLKVLYVEGGARVEETFIRRSLAASPGINVEWQPIDAQRPETRPKDILKWFVPGAYDVYLLGDVDSTAFTTEELTALAEAIRGGAGFAMFGGIHSFGAGGYGATPLADVLPIRMDRLERQNFGEDVRADLHWKGPLRMRPTQIGKTQSLFKLPPGVAGGDDVWQTLPPLDGANKFAGISEGGLVLATSDAAGNPPLAVMRELGRGRVLALAVDSTWRWRMRGFDDVHRRFWRQTILWLAHREDQTGDDVWLHLPQRTYPAGAPLEFTFGATDGEKRPIVNAAFTPQVVGPDGAALEPPAVQWIDDSKTSAQGRLTLPSGPPGEYRVSVSATTSAGVPLGTASARFHVSSQDMELDHTAADRTNMHAWAKMRKGNGFGEAATGDRSAERATTEGPPGVDLAGDSLEVHQFADVVRALHRKSAARERVAEAATEEPLYDRWELLSAFAGLLCLEWFLRKKWGLV